MTRISSKAYRDGARDIVGKRVEMLVVVERLLGSRVRCLCDCGNEKVMQVSHFNTGMMKSCGCHWSHGQSHTRAYFAWGNMKARCHNPKNKRYVDYGGKGIVVCAAWRESFKEFFDHMGECPEGMTIERIDTRKGYEPGNCKWATRTEQQRNRLTSRLWMIEGITYETIAEAGRAKGVSGATIRAWCGGRTAAGRYYPPKSGCTTIPVYE